MTTRQSGGTLGRMNANDLTREQCRALVKKVEPMAAYLHRLRVRMAKRGFPADDPLMSVVDQAALVTHDLHAELFCRSKDGKGRAG